MSEKIEKLISDLGAAAYLRMHGFTAVRGEEKSIVFEVSSEEEEKELEQKLVDYLNSDFHSFDSYLMSLKKMLAHNWRKRS